MAIKHFYRLSCRLNHPFALTGSCKSCCLKRIGRLADSTARSIRSRTPTCSCSEEWLAFFLHGVVEVSREATETARRVLALREEHRALITAKLGRAAANGHRVIEQLYERPIVSVADVQQMIGTTYPAANQLVDRMTQQGILQEFTGQARNRRFRYQQYIELFSDTPSPDADG